MYFEPKTECSAGYGAICEAFFFFFFNALSRAHRSVLVPTSLWLGPIDSLPFATVVFWLHLKKKKRKKREKHGKKTPLSNFFTATNCSTLAQQCFKTDLPDHFPFNFVQGVTEPCRVSCLVVTSRRSRDRKRDFQLQTTQMLEASCWFSFNSILLRTSGKCQSIKRTACK